MKYFLVFLLASASGILVNFSSANACDIEARSFAQAVGASVGKHANGMISLSHRAAGEITFACPDKSGAFVVIFAKSPRPSEEFLSFALAVGVAFAQMKPNDVQEHVSKCISNAAFSSSGYARIELGKIAFDCGMAPNHRGNAKITIELRE